MSYNLKSVFYRIIETPIQHARLLNTFSYLEYVGFRKIVKSQQSEFIDSKTLAHAVEEGRHALLLKKLAVKFGGTKFDSYNTDTMLCAEDASSYFQTLDRSCEKFFSETSSSSLKTRLIYLSVTWLIEVRALKVYTQYQEVIATMGIKAPLSVLLKEEERHLARVEAELSKKLSDFGSQFAQIKEIEENLFAKFAHKICEPLVTSEVDANA